MEEKKYTRDIKPIIEEYKRGNKQVIGELIKFYPKQEVNNDTGYRETVGTLYFTDIAINNFYHNEIIPKYINSFTKEDLERIAIQAIYDIFRRENLKYKNKKSPQLIKYIKTSMEGIFRNEFKKRYIQLEDKYGDFYDLKEHPFPTVLQDSGNNLFECYYLNENFNTLPTENFMEFLDKYINIKKELKPVQYQVYQLLLEGLSKGKIAKILGRDHVTKEIKAIEQKLNISYAVFLIFEQKLLCKTTVKIHDFLKQFDKIKRCDPQNSFDYFRYLIEFLKENYKEGEQDFRPEYYILNIKDDIETIADILIDRIYNKKITYNLIEILKNSNYNLDNPPAKDKEKIVKETVEAFKEYIKDIEKDLKKRTEYEYIKLTEEEKERKRRNKEVKKLSEDNFDLIQRVLKSKAG